MSDLQTIRNRIEKNFKHKSKWAKSNNIEAYRVYDRDIPDFPFIVDLYKDNIIVFDKSDDEIDQDKKHHLDFLLDSLIDLFKIPKDEIIIKQRFRRKDKDQYEKIESRNELIEVREGNTLFFVNLHDYLDTGLFLDHRPLRQIVLKEAKGKKVLNLFSYTGSISVYAAMGGALSVTSVDLSHNYQDWAKKNFELNKLSIREHNFIVESALIYLPKCEAKFDLIILDPPTFSNSKKMDTDFDVERDQEFIVNQCMRILNPNGVLYFSNNKRKFKLSPELSSKYNVVNITERTIPIDFHDKKIHHTFKITFKA